jgi:hypothetical protein
MCGFPSLTSRNYWLPVSTNWTFNNFFFTNGFYYPNIKCRPCSCQSYELIGRLVVDRDWWTGTVMRWQSWKRIHL